MNTNSNKKLVKKYTSPAQKSGNFGEDWLEKNGYCVKCGGKLIRPSRKNEPVHDFSCKKCGEEFEAKSTWKPRFSKRLTSGAYSTMIEKVKNVSVPDFFLLNYNQKDYSVTNLVVIPGCYFTKKMITKRNKPYSKDRPNDFGCMIKIGEITASCKIHIIKNKKVIPKSKVISRFKKVEELKGWLLDMVKCIDSLGEKVFTLEKIYDFEKDLKKKHPNNNHIRDKIRQQLQLLRDRGYLKFTGRGEYKIV